MRRMLSLLAVGLLWPAAAALAAGKTWTTSGADQFAAGKLDGVSVLSTGEVELAPDKEKLEGLEAEFVWDVEAAADGTVYVGTGGPAAVYAIKDGKVALLYKSEEKHVLSVLPLPDGSVLAATAPQGIIFRVARRGKTVTFADLDEPYVWDMALGRNLQIYCATGPNGKLIELDRDGKVTERLKVKQKNLMCLAIAADGTVYTGTDTDGYIYALTPAGKSSVLYDADESEVHDIAVGEDGSVYACTAQGEPSGPPRGPSGRPAGSPARPSEPQEVAEEALGLGPAMGAPAAHNSIYRIQPQQGAVLLARFDRMLVLSLALSGDRVIAGTGTGGRLMAVEPDMRFRILTELNSAYVTGIASLPGGESLIGAAHPGALWRLKSGCRDTGTFVSKPFDASYLSHWGRIWWQQRTTSGQSIRVKLRTGNAGEPDDYWSDWSAWATDAAGQETEVPLGRFAQFSAELRSQGRAGSPALLEADVSYRQANQRPIVEDLSVDGQSLLRKGERPEGPAAERTPPRRPPQPQRPQREERPATGQKTIAWRASDPNEDELAFDLYYRGLDEAEWKRINKEDLTGEPSFTWDTSRVPDGYYLLKVIARDDKSRPKDEALSDERTSAPLLIDNSPPAVAKLSSRRQPDGSYELSGVAVDAHSPIAKVEVSRNAQDWVPVFPADGLFDSPQEPFTYRTQPLPAGEHVFTFAATDAGDNAGSAKIVITVEQPAR